MIYAQRIARVFLSAAHYQNSSRSSPVLWDRSSPCRGPQRRPRRSRARPAARPPRLGFGLRAELLLDEENTVHRYIMGPRVTMERGERGTCRCHRRRRRPTWRAPASRYSQVVNAPGRPGARGRRARSNALASIFVVMIDDLCPKNCACFFVCSALPKFK